MLSTRSKIKHGLTRGAQVGIVVIIIIIIAGGGYGAYLLSQKGTTTTGTGQTTTTTTTTSNTNTNTTSTSTGSGSGPTAPSGTFVDDSQLGTPDSLDPQYGFFTTDGSIYTSVYQQLVEYNGSDYNTLIPVIASAYTVPSNGLNYTFTIRPGVWFSDGLNVTAATVWYSFERMIYMDAPSFTAPSNYGALTYNFNPSATFQTAWGLVNALNAANAAIPTGTTSADQNIQNAAIESLLNNFNPANTTQQAIMAYTHQAYVVVNDTASPVSATSPGTFQANMLLPYSLFASDIAVWWGAIVDPTFINAHGGTQNNTGNSYTNLNGMPGTGPYSITSASAGYSQVIINAAPHYWAADLASIPWMIQPAHIPSVQINYGISENTLEGDFGANKAQLATVGVPSIPDLWANYQYKSAVGNSYTNLLFNGAPYPGFFAGELNNQLAPTNNTLVRQAIVNALNYTELYTSLNVYNGTSFAAQDVGPLTSGYSAYHAITPPPQKYTVNVTKGIDLLTTYLNSVGQYAKLPNGSIIGDAAGSFMPAVTFYYITPITPELVTTIQIFSSNLAQIGIQMQATGITEAVYSATGTNPANTGNILFLGWVPDWPDPVFQLLYQALTPVAHLGAWVNNTYVNDILTNCAGGQAPGCNGAGPNSSSFGTYGILFNGNTTQIQNGINLLYQWDYTNAPYFWIPNPNNFFFLQPYLKGFWFDGFIGYAYNTLYYT